MTGRVFLCHVASDKDKSDLIARHLEGAGVTCWYSSRDIGVGREWAAAITEAILGCSVVLVLVSEKAQTSRHVLRELQLAVSHDKAILPVKIDDFEVSMPLGYLLSVHQAVDAFSPPFSGHLDRIAAAVLGILGESPFRRSAPKEAVGPYSGFPSSSMRELWNRWFRSKGNVKRRSARTVATNAPSNAPLSKMRPGFNVFICYRRREGAAIARLLRNELQSRTLRAFLDVEDLGAGHYDNKLLSYIEEAPNFVPILTPDCLSREGDDEDWMLKEIAHAIANERNIVPMVMPGFRFPNPLDLPDDIRGLPRHNGVEFSNSYYQSMIERLLSYLVN